MTHDDTPLFAIITRTKNRELLLSRAVESVASQTAKSYLHVIINDGGDQEKVEQVLERYPDKNRLVIHNETSVGRVPALNQAIRASKSQYITILDDDDSWLPERLETSRRYIKDYPEYRAHVVKMDIVEETVEDDKLVGIDRFLHPESGEGEISLYKQCIRNYLSNGILTYERTLYDELGGYDDSLEIGEDWDFGLRLLLKYDVGFDNDGDSVVLYHQRPDGRDEMENSTHGKFEILINRLRNKYLRLDLEAGRYGVGVVMNREEYSSQQVVRLEGHVNRTSQQITESFQQELERVSIVGRMRRLLKRYGSS